MNWNSPYILWLLWSTPLIAGIIYLAENKRRKRLKLFLGEVSIKTVLSKPKSIVRGLLLTASLASLIVAAAGPRWGYRWIETRSRGFDIMIAIDVSRSMDAKDVSPSRIERAKRLIRDLLEVSEGDRIGLVAFAGSSFVQCPLTSDHEAVRMFLEVIGSDLIPVQGTDLAGAIELATKSFVSTSQGADSVDSGRFLLLLSDGEDHAGHLDEAIKGAKEAGIKTLSVGMGTVQGSPIPSQNGSFKKDRSGNLVISKLAEADLKKIAESNGGQYWAISDSGADAASIYRQQMRGAGTETEVRASKEKVWYERYQIVAAVALVLILLELMVKDLRVAVFVIFASGLFFENKLFARDWYAQYEEAQKLAEKDDVQHASEKFTEISQGTSGELKRRSLFNLGVLKAKQDKLEDAVKDWTEALALDPQDQQVRDNLKWAQKQQENKKEDPKDDQNKDQKDSKENQDKKDDQKKDDQKKDDKQKSEQNKKDDQKKDDKQNENQDKDQKQNEKPKNEKPSKQEEAAKADPKELSKKEAEKLLRMVPDDLGRFYKAPDDMPPKKDNDGDEDW